MDLDSFVEILKISFLGNTVKQWLLAVLTGIVAYQLVYGIKYFVSRQLHKYFQEQKNYNLSHLVTAIVDSVSWIFIASLSISLACLNLKLQGKVQFFVEELPVIAVLVQLGYWGKAIVNYNLAGLIQSKPDPAQKKQIRTIANPVRFILLGILWSVLLLACLANLGVNVTAFVAGLGVGGVALALAVQSTLSDLIASLSIAFGKPFMVGDFIIVDTAMGTVEAIGIKMTKMRSLSGELIVIPNSQLMTSRISNFNNMVERRVLFTFSINSRTATEDLRKIPELVKAIVLEQSKTRFDRAHFARFSQFSLEYEVVYFVQSPDYNFYMDVQQAINFRLIDELRGNRIQLAQTLSELSLPDNGMEKVTTLLAEKLPSSLS